MATTMQAKYNKKRQNAKTRNIDFSLTFVEYRSLVTRSDVCDYTGIQFDSTVHIRSIERINDKEGYHADNCCVVSRRVNQLKDTFFDKDIKNSITRDELELVTKIGETLKTKTREQLTAKYLVDIKQEEEVPVTEVKKVKHPVVAREDRKEIDYVNMYQGMHDKDNTFNISFAKFKALHKRKTCSITRLTFEDGQKYGVICKKDSSQPWSDKNVHIVCRIVLTMLHSGMEAKVFHDVANFLEDK